MVRSLKMKKLDYIFKAENITTGNLFEVFVEKFTLLTAHPSHGFSAFHNILPLHISKLPVHRDSGVTSVDGIYWRGRADYTLSPQPHLLQEAPSATGQQKTCTSISSLPCHGYDQLHSQVLLIPASKPEETKTT